MLLPDVSEKPSPHILSSHVGSGSMEFAEMHGIVTQSFLHEAVLKRAPTGDVVLPPSVNDSGFAVFTVPNTRANRLVNSCCCCSMQVNNEDFCKAAPATLAMFTITILNYVTFAETIVCGQQYIS